MRNLSDYGNPIRFNNFAYAIRELVGIVLKRLVDDDQIRICEWYKNETQHQCGVSQRQRSHYAVQGGLSDDYLKNELGLDTDFIHKYLRDAHKQLNKFTHIRPNTYNISDSDCDQFVADTLQALEGLFEAIEKNRALLLEKIWEHLDDATINSAISNTIVSVDELATHHSIDEVYVDTGRVTAIDATTVTFEVTGVLTVELQWGSNSDLRKGDGATMAKQFPFRCVLESPTNDPDNIAGSEDAFGVDTSSWWANYTE